MKTEELIEALTALPFANRSACFVGDVLSFVGQVAITTPTIVLTRKPAASSATMSGTTFTPDAPGRYVFDVVINGCSKRLVVTAFPTAAKTWPIVQYHWDGTTPRTADEISTVLTAAARCVRDTDYASLSTLEVASPAAGCITQLCAAAGVTPSAIGF